MKWVLTKDNEYSKYLQLTPSNIQQMLQQMY
jgi:hypothetical protein